jgi:hypothetical protein
LGRDTLNANQSRPHWRVYERAVAAFVVENDVIGIDLTPTINASIVGTISGAPRQIDVLIDSRWDTGRFRRIIVDAKRYRTKVDIKDVESLLSMMVDCRADHGIIVCPNGWTPAALRRAQDEVTITLLTEDDAVSETRWAHFEDCLGTCSRRRDPSKAGIVLMDSHHALNVGGMWTLLATGKCDVCRCFHVWCIDCGQRFALRREHHYTCDCGFLWSSVIEEETDDETGETLNAVHLLLVADHQLFALDRQMLR